MPDAPAPIRSLRPHDTGFLHAALARSLTATYPGADAWLGDRLHAAGAGDGEAFVALDGHGHPCGFLLAQLKARGVKISCLWVAAGHRRRSIGTRLVDRAVAAFGARRLYLTVDQDQAPAIAALLEPSGFAEVAQLPGRYRPGRVEHVWARPADPDPVVRALSLTRPWGSLILGAGKNVENRSRRTSHRGLLVLHAAQSTTGLAAQFCPTRRLPTPGPAGDDPTGYLGVAHLVGVDCHDDDCASSCSPWAMDGSWHWRLAFPAAFAASIPGRGNVSLWTPPTEVLDAVRALLP